MTEPSQNSPSQPRLHIPDVPLDAANQSLAEALRASFGVLKAIMVVLVVLFMFSGLKCVQEHERAVVLRLGKLLDEERSPGPSLAWPYPIDETLRVGVTAETLKFDSHWFQVRPDEAGLSLNQIMRPGGLHPKRDGSLLTGDRGLAHVQWSLVYRITDLTAFVANVSDANDAKARRLIETVLMNAAVHVAAGLTAEEITQTRTDACAKEVKRLVNQELARLNTGIEVTTVEIPLATVPLQTREAFVKVTKAENTRTAKIRGAEQKRSELLNAAGGASYKELLARLDELDAARARGDAEEVSRIEERIDYILENEASGVAGASMRSAKARYTELVQALRGDVEEVENLLPEYERAPQLLIDRLWQRTEQRILGSKGVTKWFLPAGHKEVRIQLGPDPRDQRQAEEAKYRAAEGKTEVGMADLGFGLSAGREAGGGK